MTKDPTWLSALRLVPLALALVTLWGIIRTLWNINLGRRWAWTRRFARMAPGMNPDLVKEIFGNHTFETHITGRSPATNSNENDQETTQNWVDQRVTVRTWILHRDGYLMTWNAKDDETEQVFAYSLTTASYWFSPQIHISMPGDRWIHLGRTTFANALPEDAYQSRLGWVGARRSAYWESYYWGNPGGYLTWYVGYSGSGYSRQRGTPVDTGKESTTEASIQNFRESTSINCILITTGLVDVDFENVGADYDFVRLAPIPTRRKRVKVWFKRKTSRRPIENALGKDQTE
jgi:hypothetical protein